MAMGESDDVPIPFGQAYRRLPGEPSYGCVYHWWSVGLLNSFTRETVKLDAVRLPSGMATTMASYRRFIDALNAKRAA